MSSRMQERHRNLGGFSRLFSFFVFFTSYHRMGWCRYRRCCDGGLGSRTSLRESFR